MMSFPILFKGHPIQTPQGLPFVVPSVRLKELVESEMQDLKEWPAPVPEKTMTALSLSAIDRKDLREKVIEGVLKDLASDQIILWVDDPESLVQLQNEIWRPLIDQFNVRFHTHLNPITGIFTSALEAGDVRDYLESLSDFELTGISHLATLTHSPILSILSFQDQMTGPQVFEIADLHESHQRLKWGEDPLVLARNKEIQKEICDTLEFLKSLAADRSLSQLLDGIHASNLHEEAEFGAPTGREIF